MQDGPASIVGIMRMTMCNKSGLEFGCNWKKYSEILHVGKITTPFLPCLPPVVANTRGVNDACSDTITLFSW